MDSAGAEAGHLQRVFTSACERFRALPKADLHCHAMLSAPFEAYSQLAYECRERPPRLPPKVFCSFGEFEDYLGRELLRLLNCVEAREQIFTAALRQMEADRIVRVQCSFDAFMRERVGVAWDPLMHNMRKLARALVPSIELEMELGISHEYLAFKGLAEVEAALASGEFAGVDIYGDEAAANPDQLRDLIACVKLYPVYVKLHCAEQVSGEQAYEHCMLVQPDAIQHGTRAIEAPNFMAYLSERQIPLHLAPASNIALGVNMDYATHPIRALFDAGIRVTIASDDYAVFGVSVSEQYAHLLCSGVFSLEELDQIRLNGLTSS